jgi:TonB family protein
MNAAADKFTPFIVSSAVLHVSLFLLVAFGPLLFPKGPVESWGTSSDKGLKVGLTDSVPGLLLPSPPVVNESAKPTDTKTLHPAEVAPKEAKAPPKPAEIKIPERGARTAPKPAPSEGSRTAKADTPAPTAPANAVPGDGTGQVALRYGQPGAGQATFGGDGSFGSKYPYYVTSLTNAVQAEWVKHQPTSIVVGASKRVYVSFTIRRVGRNAAAVADVTLSQPSGSTPLDNSALKAVTAAKLPPLPTGYAGSSVDVRFYFDYTR